MIPKKSQKMNEEISKMESNAKKARRKVQNHCSHNDRRNIENTLKIYKDNDGRTYIRCLICGENQIPLNPPTLEELKSYVAGVRTATNYIKMRQDAEDDRGGEIVEMCGRMLDDLDNFQKIYENVDRGGKQKQKNRQKDSRCVIKA